MNRERGCGVLCLLWAQSTKRTCGKLPRLRCGRTITEALWLAKLLKSSEFLYYIRTPATNFSRSKLVMLMPKSTTLPMIGAVFRRKRDPAQESRTASISSNESAEAPILPYFLKGPLITPGNTPGWANQPWHYVFKVSVISVTPND